MTNLCSSFGACTTVSKVAKKSPISPKKILSSGTLLGAGASVIAFTLVGVGCNITHWDIPSIQLLVKKHISAASASCLLFPV